MAHAGFSRMPYMYEDIFPDRLTRFQHSPCSPDDHIVDIGAPPKSSSRRHDAESAFWLLVWWVVNSAPADSCKSGTPIGSWATLIGTTGKIIFFGFPNSYLDPPYAPPLSELLRQLGQARDNYRCWHWATDTLAL